MALYCEFNLSYEEFLFILNEEFATTAGYLTTHMLPTTLCHYLYGSNLAQRD